MKQICTFITVFLVLGLVGCAAVPAEENPNLGFTYQGTVIAIDAEASPILAALGEPKSCTEEKSCAFDGLDKTYHYGSFYLVTSPRDGADHVSCIWFADDSVSTREGISVGASGDEVREAYGDALGEQNVCILIQGNSKLTVLLEDDVVTSVRYDLIIP